ncbi:MAG: phospholipase D-like domain-containing protein, partial [Phycisphaeraceae bacterium]
MNWFLFFQLLEWGIRLLMLVVILRRRLRPTTALAWLMVIFLIPEVGVFFYLMFGDARLGRRRTKLHRRIVEASRRHGRMGRQSRHILRPHIAKELEPVILQAEKIGGMTTLGGNDVELLGDTVGLIDRIIEDIDQATHHVHMMFYIYSDDETGRRVSAALRRAARRGVQCRLLVDGAGSWKFTRCGAIDELREHGVRVEIMLPIRLWRRGLARIDLRNHRKLVVIDGRIAYTGSHNIVNPDYGKGAFGSSLAWVDLTGRFAGPIVHQLQIVFLEDWAFEMGELFDDETMTQRVKEATGTDLDNPSETEA